MSAFGAFLDPVADKLIVVGALVILLYLNRVDMLVALIIIGREIAISALREWMAKVGQAKSVAVAFVGKLKTVSQMVDHVLALQRSVDRNRYIPWMLAPWASPRHSACRASCR